MVFVCLPLIIYITIELKIEIKVTFLKQFCIFFFFMLPSIHNNKKWHNRRLLKSLVDPA